MGRVATSSRAAMLATALAIGLGAVLGAVLATPATAACHVAGFVQRTVTTQESAPRVTLTVELVGRQQGCNGTVDFATMNGSAMAGSDYVETTGQLTFVDGDSRTADIVVPLLDDTTSEADEEFTVVLSNPTGGISSTAGPATVRVSDDDAPTGDATTDDAPTDATTNAPTDDATTDAPTDAPTDATTNAPTDAPTDATTDAPTALADAEPDGSDGSDEGGAPNGLILVVVAALLGAGGVALSRRRS